MPSRSRSGGPRLPRRIGRGPGLRGRRPGAQGLERRLPVGARGGRGIDLALMLREAARWGEPAIALDSEGVYVWCVPATDNNRVVGGLFAAEAAGSSGAGAVPGRRRGGTGARAGPGGDGPRLGAHGKSRGGQRLQRGAHALEPHGGPLARPARRGDPVGQGAALPGSAGDLPARGARAALGHGRERPRAGEGHDQPHPARRLPRGPAGPRRAQDPRPRDGRPDEPLGRGPRRRPSGAPGAGGVVSRRAARASATRSTSAGGSRRGSRPLSARRCAGRRATRCLPSPRCWSSCGRTSASRSRAPRPRPSPTCPRATSRASLPAAAGPRSPGPWRASASSGPASCSRTRPGACARSPSSAALETRATSARSSAGSRASPPASTGGSA